MSGGRSPRETRRRILMLAPQFRPLVGGYERAAERLSIALAHRGHRVEVLSERRMRSWPPEEWVGGVRIRRVPVVFRPGVQNATWSAAALAFMLRRRGDFDVLHVHQYGTAAAAPLAIARRLGWRTVLKLTSAGPETGIAATLAGAAPHRRWVRRQHRLVDACVAMTAATRLEAQAFGIPAERVHAVPNGIDVEAFRPAGDSERAGARAELGIGAERLVLYLGRLSEVKDPDLLLEAWSLLSPRVPGAVLALVGDGPLAAKLRRRVSAESSLASVRLVGAVRDPAPWLRAADLFVLPSRTEGLSNTLLEALASGVPVVSTPVSGSVDVFAGAAPGILLDGFEAAPMAGAIAALLEDPERRRRCAVAARRIAEDSFSLPRVAERMERVYEAALRPEG